VILLEHRPVLADTMGEQLLDERVEGLVANAERGEVLQRVKAAPDLSRIGVLFRQRPRHPVELFE
jgi:hypothetical protein